MASLGSIDYKINWVKIMLARETSPNWNTVMGLRGLNSDAILSESR